MYDVMGKTLPEHLLSLIWVLRMEANRLPFLLTQSGRLSQDLKISEWHQRKLHKID